MNIIKSATDWARAEIFSSQIFILLGIFLLLSAIGFWQLGKTELAKAFVIPTLIASLLLVGAGISFFISNKTRLANLEIEYRTDTSAFLLNEIERTSSTMHSYETIAMKGFPIIISLTSILLLLINKPLWKAICMTIIGLLLILLIIDSHAHTRIKNYHKDLQLAQKIFNEK